MHRLRSVLSVWGLGLLAAVAMGTGALAQDEQYDVYHTGGQKFTIDADLGDWSLLPEDKWIQPDSFTEFGGGHWNGKEDHSVRFALLWNEEGLYVAFDVTDDDHINTQLGNQIWNGDSVQIFIEPTGERKRRRRRGRRLRVQLRPGRG
ncbi:MAG: hypothetical protein KatS3mg115_2465 [Candidatus Poribacteria bacterium]|nr:MAG: hypothetical protein KatS3mg115_2465 [Candidatus Poribacteria bacterium]